MKIGKFDVFHSTEFIAGEAYPVYFTLHVPNGNEIEMEFHFEKSLEASDKPQCFVKFLGPSTFKITLQGWGGRHLGVITPFPFEFAAIGGQKLSLVAWGQTVGNHVRVFVQFMAETQETNK